MSLRRIALASLSALWLTLACTTWVREGDEQKGAVQTPADFDRALETLLRPGSVVVVPFDFYPDGELSVDLHQWGESGEPMGGVVVLNGGAPKRVLGVGANGALTVSGAPGPGEITKSSSAAVDGSRLVRACVGASSVGWRFDDQGCLAWTANGSGSAPFDCQDEGIIGPSGTPGRVAALWRSGALWAGSLELGANQSYAISEAPRQLPDSAGTLRFVEETTAGELATVIEDAGTWKYAVHPASGTGTEVTTTAIGAGPNDVESVRRESAGALLVATESSLYRWHVESDASVEDLGSPPPSGIGDGSWTPAPWLGGALATDSVPNENEPTLQSYRAFRSRSVVAGAWDVVAPAATPCTSDAACRQFGESRLVGVLAHGATPWAIYELWAWEMLKNTEKAPVHYENVHTVVAVPLFKPLPDQPTCAPPTTIDGGVGGTGGAAGAGGSAGSAGSAGSDAGVDASLGGAGGAAGGGGSAGTDASTGGTGGTAGSDAGVGGSGGAAGSDAGTDSGIGGSAAIDSMIRVVTPYEVLANTASALVLTGEGFDSSHKIHFGSTTLSTNFLSATQVSASLTTTQTSSAGLIEVWAEGATPASRTNIAYLRVYRTTQPEIVDYIRGWGQNGDTVTVIGRRFSSITFIADPSSNSATLTLGAKQTWNGELMDTGTFTLGNWTSGQLAVDEVTIPFKGRDFRVVQNLAAATGATVTASTQQTGWEAARAVDGDIGTSWFSTTNCAGVCSGTGPTLRVTLAAPSTVARIKIRGNREKSTNYDFLRSRLTLEGAGSSVLWTHEYTHPAPERDVDVLLPTPVNGVVAVVFEGREDQATASGIAELEVFSN